MKNDWVKLRKVKGGHSYWRRISDGEIGICDDSGTYPENVEPADNPPLLLDRSRPVRFNETHGCSIPLKHENGDTSATPASGFEALWVASTFRMAIEAKEKGGKTITLHGITKDLLDQYERAYAILRSM